jgi:exo-beta-1,3-glucanase (GH17 family)
MKKHLLFLIIILSISCTMKENKTVTTEKITARSILGNPNYPAISYGGYRQKTRDIQPTMDELKEDLKILYAMGIRILRTYNVHLAEAENLLKCIRAMKTEDPTFEMYIMLGAWIDCKNAWTDLPLDHNAESEDNAIEINKAVELAREYEDIVKIIAVGNEAMVKWATSYYVQPWIILKWVNFLQELKKQGDLDKDLWITSSDNFASWGGGSSEYHNKDLVELIGAVDYISMHTYPMHDTHYNPEFWGVKNSELKYGNQEIIDSVMTRALNYAVGQYNAVKAYLKSNGLDKPVHIGETGWASHSNELYGSNGSKATDEYKSAKFYHLIRKWSNDNKVSCFYFEAFDEQWKDQSNPEGSENHFGLINLQSQAKYALWDMVDKGVFDNLTRDGKPITKTYDGNVDSILSKTPLPNVFEQKTMQKL